MGDDIFHNVGFLAGLGLVYFVVLSPFVLLGLAIPYAILHSRDSRGLERDPHLGIKTALYFFYSLSILVVLTGLTIIAVDMVQERQGLFGMPGQARAPQSTQWFNDAKRFGTGLIFAGVVFGLIQFVLLQTMTNDRRWPLPRRVFTGWRLAISGLVVLITFSALVVNLFQENVELKSLKNWLAILSVWTPAALVDLILLRYRSRRYAVDDEQFRERMRQREPES
jgi:hypothetical protein